MSRKDPPHRSKYAWSQALSEFCGYARGRSKGGPARGSPQACPGCSGPLEPTSGPLLAVCRSCGRCVVTAAIPRSGCLPPRRKVFHEPT